MAATRSSLTCPGRMTPGQDMIQGTRVRLRREMGCGARKVEKKWGFSVGANEADRLLGELLSQTSVFERIGDQFIVAPKLGRLVVTGKKIVTTRPRHLPPAKNKPEFIQSLHLGLSHVKKSSIPLRNRSVYSIQPLPGGENPDGETLFNQRVLLIQREDE